jgi:hypothetical protein
VVREAQDIYSGNKLKYDEFELNTKHKTSFESIHFLPQNTDTKPVFLGAIWGKPRLGVIAMNRIVGFLFSSVT